MHIYFSGPTQAEEFLLKHSKNSQIMFLPLFPCITTIKWYAGAKKLQPVFAPVDPKGVGPTIGSYKEQHYDCSRQQSHVCTSAL